MKQIHIFGGGTFSHVRNHLALAAPAFGETARQLSDFLIEEVDISQYQVFCHLTKMASRKSELVTNEDVASVVDQLITDPNVKIIFFNVALCDFTGQIGNIESGKYAERLHSRQVQPQINLTKSDKLIKRIRKERKDIFLVAFKTTCNYSEQEQYLAGLDLLKENSCNLVLANDTGNHRNMIIVPEEAKYCVTTDRELALQTLCDITLKRSTNHFTRSTVVPSFLEDWYSEAIPNSLRTVIEYCIDKGAYKQFRGNTAGHFAVKVDKNTFFTSIRSSNFNEIQSDGLVRVVSTGLDSVVAYGAKPSVGGQSQRIIFNDHAAEDLDCIVHFHCPLKEDAKQFIPVKEQYPYECGSHECGQNTSNGLVEVWKGIWAVMLDNHGPNIVFNRSINPERVTAFINTFFDLSQKTGGLVSI